MPRRPPSTTRTDTLCPNTTLVRSLTKGLAGRAKQRKVRVATGEAKFVSANELEITGDDGKTQLLKFDKCIIAAGSQAVKLPFFPWDDPRVMDSTDALELADVPKQLLVVGGEIGRAHV